MSTVTVARLGETVGAEVRGLDARSLVEDPALPEVLLDLLDRHGVLVFRDLFLQAGSQVAFWRRLGDVDMSPGHHRVPGIYWLTMDESKNPNGSYLRATFAWHIDGCTPIEDEYPQKATVLSAVALDMHGAVTEFASSYAAYDDLGQEEKERLSSMKVTPSRPRNDSTTPIPPPSRWPGGGSVPSGAPPRVAAPEWAPVARADADRRLRGRYGIPRRS